VRELELRLRDRLGLHERRDVPERRVPVRRHHVRRGRGLQRRGELRHLRLAHAIVLVVVVLATPARADIAPSNLRPCEGKGQGAACETDRCVPGACVMTTCKEQNPACLPCQLARLDGSRDSGCDEECRSSRGPCAACAPSDPRLEERAADTNRWDDCARKKEGDACRTASCGDGRCSACNDRDCESRLVCEAPAKRSYGLGLGAVVAVGILAAAWAALRAWKRR
jgi:hypothetical protein